MPDSATNSRVIAIKTKGGPDNRVQFDHNIRPDASEKVAKEFQKTPDLFETGQEFGIHPQVFSDPF